MKNEDFQKLTTGIQEKLGSENTALVADDLTTLISDNSNMNAELDKKDKEIEQLKSDKERLIQVNGNLLQKVSMGSQNEFNKKPENENNTPKQSLKDAFDSKGNFI